MKPLSLLLILLLFACSHGVQAPPQIEQHLDSTPVLNTPPDNSAGWLFSADTTKIDTI